MQCSLISQCISFLFFQLIRNRIPIINNGPAIIKLHDIARYHCNPEFTIMNKIDITLGVQYSIFPVLVLPSHMSIPKPQDHLQCFHWVKSAGQFLTLFLSSPMGNYLQFAPFCSNKGTFAQIRILMMQDDILSFFQMYNA